MLGDIAIARGLITFLFAIGTIGIAVLMVSALFVGSESGLKERFDHGNQILTALIAILGTVVGFYFGSQANLPSASTQNGQIVVGGPPQEAAAAGTGGQTGETTTEDTPQEGAGEPTGETTEDAAGAGGQ